MMEKEFLTDDQYNKIYNNKRIEKDCSSATKKSAKDPVLRQSQQTRN